MFVFLSLYVTKWVSKWNTKRKDKNSMKTRKKKNGDGTVFQISSGKWVSKIRMGTRPDGKPNIKQFSAKTQAEARDKLKEFKERLEFRENLSANNNILQDYICAWLKECQCKKLKPSSYDRMESTINTHIIPCLGKFKIDKITRTDIQLFINQLYEQQGLSYSSIKKVYVALNACYKYALLDSIIVKNPCEGVILPPIVERTKAINIFTLEELERLKTAILSDKCYYGYAFLLILNTGLRMGEALALLWLDVDFTNKTITVNKTITMTNNRNSDGEIIGGRSLTIQHSLKTSNGYRTIPINKSAENALLMLKNGNNSEYVIVNNRQHPVMPSNFERSFHRLLDNAKIDKCGVHTLRHTFASLLFHNGVDVKVISKLLGHSTVKITYDTYIHLLDEDLADVTTLLD